MANEKQESRNGVMKKVTEQSWGSHVQSRACSLKMERRKPLLDVRECYAEENQSVDAHIRHRLLCGNITRYAFSRSCAYTVLLIVD